MISARLLWTEYPYRAGYCITDDTDAAAFGQTKTVYDYLVSKGFVTTKTVWPFKPEKSCGIPPTPDSTLRGITLENKKYFDYCRYLSSKGFEICLHSASAGNNKRDRIIRAFKTIQRYFGHSPTFICHSKNAENIYWEHKITKLFPFNVLLRIHSKYKCYGEIEGNEYFWGDICKKEIQQIRLFRTRIKNTLKANPSMPYHDRNKNYVNYWFSATKRRIADCATPDALKRLKKENGLTVLYQYLHRYAEPEKLLLDEEFKQAIDNLSADKGLHISTVSNHMQRLREVRNIIVISYNGNYWIFNGNKAAVRNLQFHLSNRDNLFIDNETVRQERDTLICEMIGPHNMVRFSCDKTLVFRNCRFIKLHPGESKIVATPKVKLHVNLRDYSEGCTRPDKEKIEYYFTENRKTDISLEDLSWFEEYRLLAGQLFIILREVIFKGRSLNNNKFLDSNKEIRLEDHNNW